MEEHNHRALKFENLKFMFRALRSKNYRRYFFANGISLIGTWMQRIATSWLVYRITNSPVLLGTIDFATQFSAFLLMPISGVLLEFFNLRKFLIISQALGGVQAAVLAYLTISEIITFKHVVIMSVVLGLVNSFDLPGRHAFAVYLVDRKEDLGNAIAMNSSLFNVARLIGPSIAGIVVATWGEGVCFLLNAISFIPIILALYFMKVKQTVTEKKKVSIRKGLKEGLIYAFSHPIIRPLLILLAIASFIGMSFVVLLPIYAKEILHGGPKTYGFLMGALGIGALLGALFLAARRDSQGLPALIGFDFVAFGFILSIFAWSKHLVVALILMGILGFFMTSGWAGSNTLLQTVVDDDKRARVMSLYMMCFLGMAPLGSIAVGYVSQFIGPPVTLTISGICCVVGGIAFLLSNKSFSTYSILSKIW